jgi:hypothetical protein
MRKALCGAAVVCVAIVGFASAAGAASQHQTSMQAKVATRAGAVAYLESLGIDARGVVIQRGARNYAGPRCPGAGWNCTTSMRVFQISTSSAGGNTYSCKPQTGGSDATHSCVIVQTSTTANNTAACKITYSATVSDPLPVNQSCSVTQTSGSGTNRAELKTELTFSPLATSEGTQQAGTSSTPVKQTSGSGANVVTVNQKSTESIIDNAPTTTNVSWSQSADQDIVIVQESSSGTNSVDASQELSQTQTALSATSGSQAQFADQQASVDQSSSGVSTLSIKQVESQTQKALSPDVAQSQIGPQGCCSDQVGNPANTAKVKQIATQVQEPGGTGDTQTEQQTVTYTSSGNISGSSTTTQDGTTSTSSFSGSTVSQSQGCSQDTCSAGPLPENWQSFFWSGGDGATAGPFAVSAAAPVVVSVTDGFCPGDRFTISDGATPLGTTSVPGESTCAYAPQATTGPAAWADPTYSRGTFALGAGSHSLGIVVSTSPFGGGQAFYSVDPMTSAHCTDGRWATFTNPAFTSQANCLAFVGA